MARTQMNKRGIANHTLTGASFRTELEIYDETTSYIIGDIVLWKNGSWKAAAAIPNTIEGDLQYSPDNNINWERLQALKYNVYQTTSQTFNNIQVDMNLDVERAADQLGRIQLVGNAIKFNINERVIIDYSVGFNGTSNTRVNGNAHLEISNDSGATWTVIPNTTTMTYHRNNIDGLDSASLSVPIDVLSGDMVKVVIASGSNTNITTVPTACSITVFTTVGSSGPRGIQGPVGPAGDLNWKGDWVSGFIYSTRETVYHLGSSYISNINNNTSEPTASNPDWQLVALRGSDGSGTSINITDEGTLIPNSPHSTLNFKGQYVVAQDAGSGIAEIVISPTKQTYNVAIWAEENAVLSNNTYEWAFGNGANTGANRGPAIYVPVGYTADIVAVGLTLAGGTATVRVELDGVDTGASVTTTFSTNPSSTQEVTPVSVSNNQRLNFKTVSATGTSGPCVATAWIKYTEI